MIQPHDYAIEISADEAGVWVRVRHKILGSQREARPTVTESVGAVRDRLIAEIAAEIYDPSDFVFDIGHTRENGVAKDFLNVTHKPTGLRRGYRWIKGASYRDLLDEMLTELWLREDNETSS